MEAALKSGCRHFDTNNLNKNERIVGKVIERWISRGLLKREELFITATLPMAGVHPERVEIFMDKSLKNLGLDYVDLYLIQFPVTVKYNEIIDLPVNEMGEIQTETTDLIEVWQKMEDMSDYSRARAIGVSNFNKDQILRILEKARIKPAVLQIEIHPYFQNQHLVDFCGQKGITVVAYSPFGSPRTNPFNKEEGSLLLEHPEYPFK
ncbi:hypothetical protein WA026_005867 [Henosepilachna vigintioctopunctata]|uniref:NADP-dependent oxidoreductase domain-containing protein n=1 Tax=Henosepilachna vigintioctopunctata TaxID=420089 RepID=A0AAW1U288_9CUCU